VGDSGDTSLLQGVGSFKEGEVDLGRIELEGQYKKKLEDVAGEWKNKLYEIVYKYEDELDALRLEMSLLTSDKELLEKKLFTLANDKYEVENKLIEKEKELYLSGRESKSPSTISHPNDHHIQSDFLLSAAEIITKGT
jgi:predicted nuclease with TOPRIM domain